MLWPEPSNRRAAGAEAIATVAEEARAGTDVGTHAGGVAAYMQRTCFDFHRAASNNPSLHMIFS